MTPDAVHTAAAACGAQGLELVRGEQGFKVRTPDINLSAQLGCGELFPGDHAADGIFRTGKFRCAVLDRQAQRFEYKSGGHCRV
jgi:hypothetical protein